MEAIAPKSLTTCPKCSYPAPDGAIDCPACGIVYAKYRPPGELDALAAPAGVADGGLFDPYAPPKSDLRAPARPADDSSSEGVWREGDALVMQKDAVLPDRCLRCNRPSDLRLRTILYWHQPIVYLTILIGFLLYVVFALLTRKKAVVELPLCHDHARARKTWLTVGVVILLTATGLAGYGFSGPDLEVFWVLGLVVAITAVAVLSLGSKPVRVRKIDDRRIWLVGVSQDLLATLPDPPFYFEF